MIEVVCAIIINAEGKVFSARRAAHKPSAGFWEFPGGKKEAGESAEAALQREIKEELNLAIQPGKRLKTLEWKNKLGHFQMEALLATADSEHWQLSDHDAANYFSLPELAELEMMVADLALLAPLEAHLRSAT